MTLSPAFQPLAAYWRLDAQQARAFWGALERSTDPVVRSWRQKLLVFPSLHREASWHDMGQLTTPAAAIEALESLVSDGTLPAREGRRIEEQILVRVDRHGRWCGDRPQMRQPWWGALGALVFLWLLPR
jgi:hypothetical protein